MNAIPYGRRIDRIEHITHRGIRIDITEGMRIAFDVTFHDFSRRKDQQWTERHEATIDEVWLDEHPNVTTRRLYLEVTEDDGTKRRVWADRDHVDRAGTLGRAPEGALW